MLPSSDQPIFFFRQVRRKKRRIRVKEKKKQKKQDERQGPHDVDAAVQDYLEPCPVDLTDGPRVGDPCNSYYWDDEWDRLAYGREHEGESSEANALGRSSRGACAAGGSGLYLVSSDVRIEVLTGADVYARCV